MMNVDRALQATKSATRLLGQSLDMGLIYPPRRDLKRGKRFRYHVRCLISFVRMGQIQGYCLSASSYYGGASMKPLTVNQPSVKSLPLVMHPSRHASHMSTNAR